MEGLCVSVILDLRALIAHPLYSSVLTLRVKTEVHVRKYQVDMSAAVLNRGQANPVVQVNIDAVLLFI